MRGNGRLRRHRTAWQRIGRRLGLPDPGRFRRLLEQARRGDADLDLGPIFASPAGPAAPVAAVAPGSRPSRMGAARPD
jgi:hypothetical protein